MMSWLHTVKTMTNIKKRMLQSWTRQACRQAIKLLASPDNQSELGVDSVSCVPAVCFYIPSSICSHKIFDKFLSNIIFRNCFHDLSTCGPWGNWWCSCVVFISNDWGLSGITRAVCLEVLEWKRTRVNFVVQGFAGRKSELHDINNGFVLQKTTPRKHRSCSHRAEHYDHLPQSFVGFVVPDQSSTDSSRPLKVCWANWGEHGHPGWSLAKQTPQK